MIKLDRIQGTAPAKVVRISLNNNSQIIESSLNAFNSILDLNSGILDNSLVNGAVVGSIKTGDIKSVGSIGLTLDNGNITLTKGVINLLATTSEINLGQSVKLNKVTYTTSNGTSSGLNLTSFVKFKNYTSLQLLDISNVEEGVVAYNTTTKKLVLYDGSGWVNLN